MMAGYPFSYWAIASDVSNGGEELPEFGVLRMFVPQFPPASCSETKTNDPEMATRTRNGTPGR
jgi:hypothetical protein